MSLNRYVCRSEGNVIVVRSNPNVVLILGTCAGVRLTERGPNDSHVLFEWLVEDDENWFRLPSTVSTAWLDDFERVLARAREWLNKNAVKEDYGWKFA